MSTGDRSQQQGVGKSWEGRRRRSAARASRHRAKHHAAQRPRSPRSPTARRTRRASPPRQRRVLDVIRDSVERRGYPPSMREIGEAVGLTSSSSVSHQLPPSSARASCAATPTGRAPSRSRPDAATVARRRTTAAAASHDRRDRQRRRPARRRLRPARRPHRRRRPDPGRAGRSRTSSRCPASSSARAPCSCSRSRATRWSTPRSATATGWSCASSRSPSNGDIVAAMIDGEATVKTFKRRDGHVWLMPHNPAYEPIPGDDATDPRPGHRGAAPGSQPRRTSRSGCRVPSSCPGSRPAPGRIAAGRHGQRRAQHVDREPVVVGPAGRARAGVAQRRPRC